MEIVIGIIVVIGIIWLILHPGFILDIIGNIFGAIFNLIGGCVGCLLTTVVFLVIVYFVVSYLFGGIA